MKDLDDKRISGSKEIRRWQRVRSDIQGELDWKDKEGRCVRSVRGKVTH